VAVANGIALDVQSNELLVTGKLWPTIFRIAI
jgi:glutamine cyclotransferase